MTLEQKEKWLAKADVMLKSSFISEEDKQYIKEEYSRVVTDFFIEMALGKEALETILWAKRLAEKEVLG